MDELNEYLIRNYAGYITGRPDCNLLVWGTDDNDVQVPRLCTLIVGIEYDPLSTDQVQISDKLNQKYAADSHFRNMYKFGDEIASRGSVPYIVMGYPSMRKHYNNRWERTAGKYPPGNVIFYLHELPDRTGGILTGVELRAYLYRILGKNYTDAGTAKAKNKSIADYFQYWSRGFLSRHLVKLDIDGIFAAAQGGVMIEIKRSNIPPIPEWRPYRDDYPDFALLKSFASSLNMKFTILHHSGGARCDGNTVISLFEVGELIYSVGRITYSKQFLQIKLEGADSLRSYLRELV